MNRHDPLTIRSEAVDGEQRALDVEEHIERRLGSRSPERDRALLWPRIAPKRLPRTEVSRIEGRTPLRQALSAIDQTVSEVHTRLIHRAEALLQGWSRELVGRERHEEQLIRFHSSFASFALAVGHGAVQTYAEVYVSLLCLVDEVIGRLRIWRYDCRHAWL